MNIVDNTIKTQATRDNIRLMIPILIHWAKTGQTNHTYGDLIKAIGKVRYSGIGRALFAVQKVLNELNKESGKIIPTLNSLCKNEKSKLPAEGFEFVSPHYNDLDDNGKRVFITGLDSKATNFKDWNWVLKKLDLQDYAPIPEDFFSDMTKHSFSTGGEGEEHKKLKEYILNNPASVGIKNVFKAETEHILPSGDRLDVYFELQDGTRVAIEVKPSTAPDFDISRGIFQCIKYSAVMDALRKVESKDYDIQSLLVTSGKLSPQNVLLAKELSINYIERFTTNVK